MPVKKRLDISPLVAENHVNRGALTATYSASIAFVKQVDRRWFAYTHLDVERNKRNCQGGGVEKHDGDAFYTAAREASEEIWGEIRTPWIDELAEKMKTMYEDNDPHLRTRLEEYHDKIDHVIFTLRLSGDDTSKYDAYFASIRDSLIEKDVGSDGTYGLEMTTHFEWVLISFINTHINTSTADTIPYRYKIDDPTDWLVSEDYFKGKLNLFEGKCHECGELFSAYKKSDRLCYICS